MPIALGILAASRQIPARDLDKYEFAGELSLSGQLRPIRGALAMTFAMHRCRDQAARAFILPFANADEAALVGGGAMPRPGEVSLAHCGVLFLDELTEFDRRVQEVLRQPMTSGSITISRAAHQADFPARFQLVAAMNPCWRNGPANTPQYMRVSIK